jgi:hypothetical protein
MLKKTIFLFSVKSSSFRGIRKGFFPLLLLLLFSGCAILPVKTFDETVSQWKSYKDLETWLAKDFSFDTERFKKFEGTLPPPRTPEETFKLKSGIYIDAAILAKETLTRIDPSYKAKIVVLILRRGASHYVCSFIKEGKIFIMDYGTPYKTMVGVHGPFSTLEEYKTYFEKRHPVIKNVQAVTYLR